MPRGLISLLITAAWLAMMALLVHDHLLPHPIGRDAAEVAPPDLADDWVNIHDFMVIQRQGRSLGASVFALERLPDGSGHTVSERLRLDVGMTDLTLEGAAELDADLQLERLWARLSSPLFRFTLRGQVDGDRLLLVLNGPLGQRHFSQTLGEPITLLDAARPRMFESIELEPGRSYRIPSADLFGQFAVSDLVLEVRDYGLVETHQGSLPAYEIATEYAGVASSVWVDEDGRLIRQPLWGDIVLERSAKRFLEIHYADLLEPAVVPDFDLTELEGEVTWSDLGSGFLSLRQIAQETVP
ncbi:hypothetical protein JXA47_13540 [Candidatus Sumerlaeota bacterium]|nr:hypothetical protein [Candidatus Sumerlaeota bacterium]